MERTKITFNRTLRASWLCEALRLKADGLEDAEATSRLKDWMAGEVSGEESLRKSLRYLRRIWMIPQEDLISLKDEGIRLYLKDPSSATATTLSFFMLIATYPFVREVGEVCGRLHRLQGSVKSEQIKRKMAALHGEREPVFRSTRYAISLLADFGLLKPTSRRGIYHAGKTEIKNPEIAAFVLAAFIRSLSKGDAIRRPELESHPGLFAFNPQNLIELALLDPRFSVSRESISTEIISFAQKDM